MSIPMGGKMEKRGVEYKCESCNKVGWFEITLYGLWRFFGFFFVSISCFLTNHLPLIFAPDLPPPKLLEQTQ